MNNPVLIMGAIGTIGLFLALVIWTIGAGPVLKRTGPANPKLINIGWYITILSGALIGIAIVILWIQTVFFGK